MAPVRAASEEQLELLLDFAEKHPNIVNAGNVGGPLERSVASQKWEVLSRNLNSLGSGCNKTANEWKRYWTLLKSRTKTKAEVRDSSTEPAMPMLPPLNAIEERVLGIIGKARVKAEPAAKFHKKLSDSPELNMCPLPEGEDYVIEENPSNSSESTTGESPQSRDPLRIARAPALSRPLAGAARRVPSTTAPMGSRRHFRTVSSTPQLAINIANKELGSHNRKIFQEMRDIREAIHTQTKAIHSQTRAINRIGNLLAIWIEKSNGPDEEAVFFVD